MLLIRESKYKFQTLSNSFFFKLQVNPKLASQKIKAAEETLHHSGSDTKHIYFVNSDPKTVGKRRLKIARFDKNLEKGLLRIYSVDYFMKSKLKLFLLKQNDLMAYKHQKPSHLKISHPFFSIDDHIAIISLYLLSLD